MGIVADAAILVRERLVHGRRVDALAHRSVALEAKFAARALQKVGEERAVSGVTNDAITLFRWGVRKCWVAHEIGRIVALGACLDRLLGQEHVAAGDMWIVTRCAVAGLEWIVEDPGAGWLGPWQIVAVGTDTLHRRPVVQSVVAVGAIALAKWLVGAGEEERRLG